VTHPFLLFRHVGSAYCEVMGRSLWARLHNPSDHACACLPTCWCKTTRLGFLVRWYTPGRWHRMANPFGFADVPDLP
jgi:hypothetical protein